LSYIGKTPTVGNFIKLDSITTSSTNSYTLQQNSVNFSPESANHMLVSLNGVIQAPNTAFSVSGSTITFLPSSGTLSSSDVIDFIMVYGNVLDVGVATTVTDSAITKGKLNLISDSSTPGLTVKGDGSSENGTIQLNCSQNSHGVKISSPAHSAGQSYELILPTGNVTADKFLKVASVSGSGATGIGQLSFADAGGITVAQQFRLTTNFSTTSTVPISSNWEQVDTDGYGGIGTAMSESSGVFTFPTTGIYLISISVDAYRGGDTRYWKVRLDTTIDNGTYGIAADSHGGIKQASSDTHDSVYTEFIFDVTDVSTHKVRFGIEADQSTTILGSTSKNQTCATFIRLGDT